LVAGSLRKQGQHFQVFGVGEQDRDGLRDMIGTQEPLRTSWLLRARAVNSLLKCAIDARRPG
jgi:hypothetical protein